MGSDETSSIRLVHVSKHFTENIIFYLVIPTSNGLKLKFSELLCLELVGIFSQVFQKSLSCINGSVEFLWLIFELLGNADGSVKSLLSELNNFSFEAIQRECLRLELLIRERALFELDPIPVIKLGCCCQVHNNTT